jgi:hypothetical protein
VQDVVVGIECLDQLPGCGVKVEMPGARLVVGVGLGRRAIAVEQKNSREQRGGGQAEEINSSGPDQF